MLEMRRILRPLVLAIPCLMACSGCSSVQGSRPVAPAAIHDVVQKSEIASVKALELALAVIPSREPELMHVPFTAQVQRMAEGWIVYLMTEDDLFATRTVLVSDTGEIVGYDD